LKISITLFGAAFLGFEGLYLHVLRRPGPFAKYAGFSTAEVMLLSIILLQDKRTIDRFRFVHRGMIQITNVVGDVGKAGVAGDTMEDMKVLFDQIPLSEMSVSHERCCTAHGFFLYCCCRRAGVKPEQLSGTIQNDISKGIHGCVTRTYTPDPP
jgi:methylmalonyl-CoA mutase